MGMGVMFVKNIQGGMKTTHGSDHGSDLAPVNGKGVGNKMEKRETQITVEGGGLTKFWPTRWRTLEQR